MFVMPARRFRTEYGRAPLSELLPEKCTVPVRRCRPCSGSAAMMFQARWAGVFSLKEFLQWTAQKSVVNMLTHR